VDFKYSDIRPLRPWVLAAVVLSLSACQRNDNGSTVDDGPAPLTASAFIDEPVLTNDEYLAVAPWADADVQLGERIAFQCKACHTLQRDGVIMVGPNLFGVFGRAAASTNGFDYSPALQNAGLTWSPTALDAWLANPARFLPGNRMPFAGISDKADRDALIAYLLMETNAGARHDSEAAN
jgi:cytochrome c